MPLCTLQSKRKRRDRTLLFLSDQTSQSLIVGEEGTHTDGVSGVYGLNVRTDTEGNLASVAFVLCAFVRRVFICAPRIMCGYIWPSDL